LHIEKINHNNNTILKVVISRVYLLQQEIGLYLSCGLLHAVRQKVYLRQDFERLLGRS